MDRYIPPPTITSDSNFFASDDSEFQLTCTVEIDTHLPYNLTFSRNGQQVETNDYVVISDIQHEKDNYQKSSINLTVSKGSKSRDEGNYVCAVTDYFKNSNSITATVNFVSEPTVTMTPARDTVYVEKGNKYGTFLVDFMAYPQASFKVYNPQNEPISSDTAVMDRYKYDVKIKDNRLTFKVKSPYINDFGNYTIVATTAGQNFTQSLRLEVSGELNVFKPHGNVINLFNRETGCQHK